MGTSVLKKNLLALIQINHYVLLIRYINSFLVFKIKIFKNVLVCTAELYRVLSKVLRNKLNVNALSVNCSNLGYTRITQLDIEI